MRIAILGAGKIGESLLAGLRSSDWADIVATSRREERVAELHERHGVEATTDNVAAIKGADVVVLAVKPQDIETLLGEIGHLLKPEQTVLSVAAAIPTASIERHIAADVPVVRSMPNAPSIVHEGIAGMCAGKHAAREHLDRAGTVLRAVGDVVEVKEDLMDAITAVSGSGPAYYALLAEAMIEAGILLGLSREISTKLVVQTMLGTARATRRADAPGRAARGGHLAGRHDDPRDPRARARGRAGGLPECDQGRDGALERARPRRC